METRFPCASRVVRNLSLVRPVIWFRSSRTMLDVSPYPVVTEPMILRLPSRMKSLFGVGCLQLQYTEQIHGLATNKGRIAAPGPVLRQNVPDR